MTKLLIISDTHEKHESLILPSDIETYDVLIHAGDASNHRIPALNERGMLDFIDWYAAIPIKNKIYVPGNHDTAFAHKLVKFPRDIHVLVHREIIIDGVKFFGSPYTPKFGTGWAYNVQRGKLYNYWEEIPEDTDVLITHGPPFGIRDRTLYLNYQPSPVGCEELRSRLYYMWHLKLHIFGHIHDEDGIKNQGIEELETTKFINASYVDITYEPANDFITIEI